MERENCKRCEHLMDLHVRVELAKQDPKDIPTVAYECEVAECGCVNNEYTPT